MKQKATRKQDPQAPQKGATHPRYTPTMVAYCLGRIEPEMPWLDQLPRTPPSHNLNPGPSESQIPEVSYLQKWTSLNISENHKNVQHSHKHVKTHNTDNFSEHISEILLLGIPGSPQNQNPELSENLWRSLNISENLWKGWGSQRVQNHSERQTTFPNNLSKKTAPPQHNHKICYCLRDKARDITPTRSWRLVLTRSRPIANCILSKNMPRVYGIGAAPPQRPWDRKQQMVL